MKSRGIFLKNAAKLCLLIALLSLLLPCCKITTPTKSVNVSGFSVLTASAKTGYQYYKNGTIDDDYVIKGDLKWGDVKAGLAYVKNHQNLKQAKLMIGVSLLPILFCAVAMILALIAIGKVSMVLTTLFTAAAFLENIFLMKGFGEFQKSVFVSLETSGIALSLLVGVYAFTILCGVTLALFLAGWLTNSFGKEESDDNDSAKERHKDKNRRDRRKKKTKKKTKTKTKKKKSKDKKKDSKKEESKPESEDKMYPANGKIAGASGIYQNLSVDLNTQEASSVTLRTSAENMYTAGKNGSSSDYFVIAYQPRKRCYEIVNHSTAHIVVTNENGGQQLLMNGGSKVVGGKTLLYVGNMENAIRLS